MLLWLLLLLFLGVDARCPRPSAIYPCICKVVRDEKGKDFSILSCHDIQSEEVLAEVLSVARGYNLFEFQLIDATLDYIPHDALVDTTFELVSIVNSTVRALSDTDVAFEGLDHSLHMFEVINCSFISDWDWTQLSHLQHLKEVVVTHSDLLEITDGLSTIQHLDLKVFLFSGNRIQNLENNVFAPFEQLTRVTLDKNCIRHLERSMFPRPAKWLKILGLSYNKLESLPMDLFQDMPALTSLFLTGNPLKTIDKTTFIPVWDQMKLFLFNDTALSCDCRISWIKQRNNTGKFIQAECRTPSHVQGRPFVSLQMHELWCD